MTKFVAREYFIPWEHSVEESGTYYRIPDVLSQSGLLTPDELLVWGVLANYAGINGKCYPSYRAISGRLPMSQRSVKRHVKSLQEKGFVEVVTRKSGSSYRSNQYHFVKHPIFDEVESAYSDKLSPPPDDNLSLPVVSNSALSGDNLSSKKQQEENKSTTTIGQEDRGSDISGCSGGFSLSEPQKDYIALKVKWTVVKGKITGSPGALRRFLVREARSGELDMSDYPDLKAWDEGQCAKGQGGVGASHPSTQDKEKLLEEHSKKNEESQQWWGELPEDHPAKQRTSPPYIPKEVWRRQLYVEFSGNGAEAGN